MMNRRGVSLGAAVVAGLVPAGCSFMSSATRQVAKAARSSSPTREPAPTATGPSAPMVEREEPPVPAASAWRVTFAEEGADFDPFLSPDGTRLFFASTQHRATSDLYAQRVGSRVVTQLTSDEADDANPALSPDGTRLAFASNRSGNWDVYVMPAGGGKAVQITSDPGDDLHPSFSPDGRRLVFCRRGEVTGRWEMWVVEVENPTRAHYVGEGLFPTWAPVLAGESGPDRILFQLPRERGRRTYALWTIDLAGDEATNATEIVSSATSAFINPSWSPDAQWVLYAEVPAPAPGQPAATRPTRGAIWLQSTAGEARVRVTNGLSRALAPAWGGENRVFFVSDRSGVDNIWCVDLGASIRAASIAMPPGGDASTRTAKSSAPANTDPTTPDHADNSVASAPESGEEPAPE